MATACGITITMFRYPSTSPFLRSTSASPPLLKLQSGSRPWAQWRLPRSLAWNQFHLPLRDLPAPLQGLRILPLSDLHLKTHWAPAYDELIEKTLQNPPDLILFTG